MESIKGKLRYFKIHVLTIITFVIGHESSSNPVPRFNICLATQPLSQLSFMPLNIESCRVAQLAMQCIPIHGK